MSDERVVLLLGSGASRGSRFSLPTMQGFFDAASLSDPIRRLMTQMYGGLSEAKDWNLEDVLSFLYASADRATTWGRYVPEPGGTYDDVLGLVRSRLTIPRDAHCALHVQLLNAAKPRTLITLNYDLVADQSFDVWANQQSEPQRARAPRIKLLSLVARMPVAGPDPIGLHGSAAQGGFFLKLHGSLDWVICSDGSCSNSEEVHVASLNGYLPTHAPGQPCGRCGASLETLIVPPLPVKSVESRRRLRLLWRLALNELAEADRIVIVGLSFAPSDFELRWLIRQARFTRPNGIPLLDIVNPCVADRNTAIGLFAGASIANQFDSLDDYIAGSVASVEK